MQIWPFSPLSPLISQDYTIGLASRHRPFLPMKNNVTCYHCDQLFRGMRGKTLPLMCAHAHAHKYPRPCVGAVTAVTGNMGGGHGRAGYCRSNHADAEEMAEVLLLEGTWCEMCRREGRVTAAEEVHHILPLADGGSHDAENLMALCKSCHSRITATDGGRWGKPRG